MSEGGVVVVIVW